MAETLKVPKGMVEVYKAKSMGYSTSFMGADNKPVLKLCSNGDIFVKGKLVENDKEVVDGMRMFLQENKDFAMSIDRLSYPYRKGGKFKNE